MPVEAFVQTGDRTMLSYLMKPFERPADARVPREVRLRSIVYRRGVIPAAGR
jgi:hypothetical protein